MIEPRKDHFEKADAVKTAEGSTPSVVLAWHRGFSGVEEQGMHALGFAGEPGRPCRFRVRVPEGPPAKKGPGPRAQTLATCGSKGRASTRYG